MRVNSINNINFGKRLVAICNTKEAKNGKQTASNLYEVDPKNKDDLFDVNRSNHTKAIRKDFNSAGSIHNLRNIRDSKFYILQNDVTKEVISCAEISKRYSQEPEQNGIYLNIKELEGNKHYLNSTSPLTGYFAKMAEELGCTRISTSFREDDMPELKKEGFRETVLENLEMPKENFKKAVENAKDNHDMIFG